MEKFLIDTNIIMRILMQDSTELTPPTLAVLKKVQEGQLVFVVDNSVILESAWVLKSYYEKSREEISDALGKFLQVRGVECDEIMIDVLRTYKDVNLDIVDIYLSIRCENDTDLKLLTWDKGFSRLGGEYYNPNDLK